MKKLIAIFLLIILVTGSFLPNMDTCELSKIPQLLEHYREHSEVKDQYISFVDFLLLHYGVGKESEAHRDQDEHENLPLHKHTIHNVIAFAPVETISFSFHRFIPATVLNAEYLYSEYSEYSFSLLQPPRV
jgi:hypothetical protein